MLNLIKLLLSIIAQRDAGEDRELLRVFKKALLEYDADKFNLAYDMKRFEQ